MLIFEKLIRKREVLISKVSIYIVVIIVLCHSVRLIPTIWEISRTFMEKEDEVRVRKGSSFDVDVQLSLCHEEATR